MGAFKEPHGGVLRELYLGEAAADEEKAAARDWRSWDLTERQLCDIELLLNGAFSPLEGFLTRAEYDSVVETMRLTSGLLWPMPITLDVDARFAEQITVGENIALRDREGVLIATMKVEDIWRPDKAREAALVFGTEDEAHPGVNYLMNHAGEVYVGGRLRGVEPPVHYDFRLLRDSPSELRGRFRKLGWRKVVAFQTRNPMHRAHQELTFRAARENDANLLIHPVVGMTRPGDVDHYTRVRCYERILNRYPEQTTTLSVLNLAMRMAGPREALWHGIIRKNFGCTHFIIGRDHSGPGRDASGKPFYPPYAAQELFAQHQDELGITMVPFQEMVYVEDRAEYLPINETTPDMKILTLSGTEFRRRLREGLEIPEWFSYPEIIEELVKVYPPRHRQGFTVFFTGLPSSGKSTIANALRVKLLENGGRRVTLLDGDIVRKNLSSELGYSREHRDLNILRIGFVAAEITKNGGVAICAPIAPYRVTRRKVREMIEAVGGFVEVHVATPVEECERRDRKGLYAKARAGLIKGMTGVDDPYEAPERPEVVIDTQALTPQLAAQRILVKLESMGFIR
ncbi:MAG: bifunctional sulfate adenylyltransferase/adenylylsulfate kinase [Rhodospirillaceae bacterium]|nr:bifunctional sulfate adenylyltransferase/adenylylsulfate kinase [Rhodospirillaceae bacterium]